MLFWRKNKNRFKCSECGEIHEEWPALTFNSPTNYLDLTDWEKENIAKINLDFCTINHEEQTDRFIRVTLFQKVIDFPHTLHYGIWVSLSEKSFDDYSANFKNENHETQYFGWLCNNIPEYEQTLAIPTTVFTKKGNNRPEIVPHQDFDHPFVLDYYNGITKNEAEKRIKQMMKNENA